MPYSQDNPVEDRLLFAERRMNDLRSLNNGNLGGAVPRERQQLIQEFFFHLVGAIDFLAQEVNIARGLGLDAEDVSPSRVRQALTATDPVQELIAQLHPYTRQKPLPSNPYSEEGSHFRIMLFRNFVSHIKNNPFLFYASVEPPTPASLILDPRLAPDEREPSVYLVFDEIAIFHDLVTAKCQLALKAL